MKMPFSKFREGVNTAGENPEGLVAVRGGSGLGLPQASCVGQEWMQVVGVYCT